MRLCLQGAFSNSLAEYAMAGCCYFAKQLPRLMQAKADRIWETFTVQELRWASRPVHVSFRAA